MRNIVVTYVYLKMKVLFVSEWTVAWWDDEQEWR